MPALLVWIGRLLLAVWALLKVSAKVAPLAVVGAGLLWGWSELGPLLSAFASSLAGVAATLDNSAPSHAILGQVNRIFPLSEMLAILGVYYTMLAATVTIKAIWSLVPKGT